ncbi:FAD/NAD(P)-binding protein [Streptomyces sp. TRM70350]|uniref:FAD/NAD(P)-binding protein n=1 Tax=Streptomyces sp. TRM70350 TaxID=2856165 RepID=UPI0027E1D098|nr:FAD/NAD(P)-binding protein [Streptomyces sp. TRM70350]
MPVPASAPPSAIALVGAGPRGTSVLERLCASAAELLPPGTPLTVHVIDPAPPGPGRVWRTAQSAELLMNTVASQVTLFTDESVDCSGPIRPGPSLYEWAGGELGPDDYPTRAQYGRYLEWVFARVVRDAPPGVRVQTHAARAVRLDDGPDGRQVLALDDGRVLTGLAAVVLAQGHLPTAPDAHQRQQTSYAARHGLRYIPPANPADVDLTPLSPGEPVLLRGLGLNFFDHMALLTTGRGGRFVRTGDGLRYVPSGREPRLYAGSRRGVPYQARGDNAKGPYGRHEPLVLTPEVIAGFRKRADSGDAPDFLTEIWPLVAKEVETVYYAALLGGNATAPGRCADAAVAGGGAMAPGGGADAMVAGGKSTPPDGNATPPNGNATAPDGDAMLPSRNCTPPDGNATPLDGKSTPPDGDATVLGGSREFVERYLAVSHGDPQEARLLDEFGVPAADRWSWERISRPYAGRAFDGPGDWRDWLLAYLREDAAQAALGNVRGPLKAALDVLRDLRNEIRLIVDHAGLTGVSRRDHLDLWYTPLNAFLSIGPPRRRIEELTALMEAGVVEVLGPRLEVRCAEGAWVAQSPEVPGSAARVTTLIEARLPEPDVRRTADELLARLLRTGQCRPHTADGYETGGLDVTRRPYLLMDRQGQPHERRFAFGVPTEGVHWVTAAGARPGVDSVTLSDADAVARAVLRVAAGTGAGAESGPESGEERPLSRPNGENVELASID